MNPKAIMISIQPQWVEKILNGTKTIEIRKTRPKCELPCKVYIYCTQGQMLHDMKDEKYWNGNRFAYANTKSNNIISSMMPYLNGKVVAEFTLNKIECWRPKGRVWDYSIRSTCLTMPQLIAYADTNKNLKEHCFAWFISDLKIYDKPKELSEFYSLKKCDSCKKSGYESSACMYDDDCKIPIQITRPPQNWCFVEELKE